MKSLKHILFFAIALCILLYGACLYDMAHHDIEWLLSADRIEIVAMHEGEILNTNQYGIKLYPDSEINKSSRSYSMPGEYGQFLFHLHWNDQSAAFFLENVNEWWRTLVILEIHDDESLTQTTVIYNNTPTIIEHKTLEWSKP